MDWWLIGLRIVHVGAGMAWFGGALIGGFFLTPAARALGAQGQPFMDQLMNGRRMGVFFPIVATLAVFSGAALYWYDSNGLTSAWASSPTGIAFAVGGLAAFIALVGGFVLIGPSVGSRDGGAQRACRQRRSADRDAAGASRSSRPAGASRQSDRPATDPPRGADDGDRSVPVGLGRGTSRRRPDSAAIRAAGATYVVLGLGFGVGTAITLRLYARDGELPMTPWGFRSLAGGPFDRLPPSSSRRSAGCWSACAPPTWSPGVWLWQGRRRGAVLGLATSPVALALGAGFALPFLLAGIPIGVALVLAGRRSLR